MKLLLALRPLARARAYALAITVSFALGIGSLSAVFTLLHATLIRALPYRDSGRLVLLWARFPQRGVTRGPLSEPELLDLRQPLSSLESVSGMLSWRFNLTGQGLAEQLSGARVSSTLLPLLGVGPEVGRAFTREEETPGRDRVVLLGHRLWRRRFGGDPGIVGRSLILNGEPHEVVGVLPDGFQVGDTEPEVWAPLPASSSNPMPRDARAVVVLARLRNGVSLAQAQAELDALSRRMEQEHPDVYPPGTGWGLWLVRLQDDLVAAARPALLALFAAGWLVLLTACGNVLQLMLARAADRRRELAIRAALGAGRRALAWPLVAEATAMTLAGCALGLCLAYWAVRTLVAMAPPGMPRLRDIAADWTAAPVAVGLALAAGLAFGALATLWSLQDGGSAALKDGSKNTAGSRRGQRTRSLLVAAQVAFAVLVLTAAGLLTQSFLRLRRVDLGFRPDHLLTFQIFLPREGFQEPARTVGFFAGLLDRMAALQGVRGAAAASGLPLSDGNLSGKIVARGAAPPRPGADDPDVAWQVVTPGYFAALGIAVERGRGFGAADHATAPKVVIVDRRLAQRLWPGQDPIGRSLSLGGWAASDWLSVVGVVGPVRGAVLSAEPVEQLYLPHAQSSRRAMFVVLRTAGDPAGIAAAVRNAVGRMAPDLPVANLVPMDDLVAATTARLSFNLWLFGTFSAIAVVLALLGLYSVAAYAVVQRRREIALRMALGAQPSDVVGLLLRQGVPRLLAGLALGLLLAWWAGHLLASQLFQVVPGDPLTFTAVALLLCGLGLLANYLPARRAARTDLRMVIENRP
jgi:putative ABC transport system permease protein